MCYYHLYYYNFYYKEVEEGQNQSPEVEEEEEELAKFSFWPLFCSVFFKYTLVLVNNSYPICTHFLSQMREGD